MRPAGEPRLALLRAANALTTPARSATLRELTRHSCVGSDAALHTVRHMRRAGLLVIVRTRRVDYCNKPVAEYAPAVACQATAAEVAAELGNVFRSWVG